LLSQKTNEGDADKQQINMSSQNSLDKTGKGKKVKNKDRIQQNSYDQNSLLRGVIRRKEAKVIATSLHYLKENEDKTIQNHKLLSLKENIAAFNQNK